MIDTNAIPLMLPNVKSIVYVMDSLYVLEIGLMVASDY